MTLASGPESLTYSGVSFLGKGTTFYSWLEVPFTATTSEISKAYRKKSLQLQYVAFLLVPTRIDS